MTKVEWLPESVSHWSVIRQEDYYNYLSKTTEFHQDSKRVQNTDETAFMNIHCVPAQIAANPELLEAIAVEEPHAIELLVNQERFPYTLWTISREPQRGYKNP